MEAPQAIGQPIKMDVFDSYKKDTQLLFSEFIENVEKLKPEDEATISELYEDLRERCDLDALKNLKENIESYKNSASSAYYGSLIGLSSLCLSAISHYRRENVANLVGPLMNRMANSPLANLIADTMGNNPIYKEMANFAYNVAQNSPVLLGMIGVAGLLTFVANRPHVYDNQKRVKEGMDFLFGDGSVEEGEAFQKGMTTVGDVYSHIFGQAKIYDLGLI
jgi:hypothetical protein